MRDYLQLANLRRAAVVGFMVTMLAVPRLMMAGVDLAVYIPACLATMMLVAGAPTAWGHYGGLPGLFPRWARVKRGMTAAVLFALIMFPFALRMDALRWELLEVGQIEHWRVMPPPTTAADIVALLLWRAGFEALFFQAATICLLARLFRDWRPALIGAVLLRGAVTAAQMGYDLGGDYAWWFLAYTLIDAVLAGGLYVIAGWPATAVFVVLLGLRHFLWGPP